jgi:hypothetical protein
LTNTLKLGLLSIYTHYVMELLRVEYGVVLTLPLYYISKLGVSFILWTHFISCIVRFIQPLWVSYMAIFL